jgi:peptidoglycan hydrolase-like protein with peptidoglycan-binding domain
MLTILVVLSSTICFASYTSTYPEPTYYLKRGSVGSSVKWLQDILNHCGYQLSVDGIFGTNTYRTVTDFQSKQHLQVDGIVGEKTITALKKAVIDIASNRTINNNLYTKANVNLRQGPRCELSY